MDDFQLVKKTLNKVRSVDLPALSKSSKVPLGTLMKVKYGHTKNPGWFTVKKLADHIKASDPKEALGGHCPVGAICINNPKNKRK